MSIRALTLELYKAQQKVSLLEKDLETTPLANRDGIKNKLREARAEWAILRKMLDGEKETGLPVRSRANRFFGGR
ncbi:MAG: hypothetical protein H8E79_02300 [Desulfobulbaceae bacterium]|uniref:Uncharacterized protein n=1 Tax=Candidatus Desulfatifera sulfidica TaxID=2841691 RepID=A0A8J6T9S5_9BACT|nr:hypothetical protein [Candidatus Desulfatifera sulfidica]